MTTGPVPEETLIARVQGGDLAAFEELMARHVRRLRAFIAMQAPIPDLIDELSHETFVFAYRRMAEFSTGDFGAWLRAIAFNLLRAERTRFARREAQQQQYVEARLAAECETPSAPAAPTLAHLEACLQQLGAATRRVVEWRYREQRDITTIATQLGRSAVAVRATLFRARRQLRACIFQRLQAEEG